MNTIIYILLALIMVGAPMMELNADTDHEKFLKDESLRDNSSGIVLIPIIFYTPDTGGAGGLSLILFKDHYRTQSSVFKDSLVGVVFYTYNRQFLSALAGNKYTHKGLIHYQANLSYSKFPTTFYGKGNDSRENTGEDYTPLAGKYELGAEVRLIEKIYAGIRGGGGRFKPADFPEGGILTGYFDRYGEAGRYNGLGFQLNRDSRNDTLVPSSGSITGFSGLYYTDSLGSNFIFRKYIFDHKSYFTMNSFMVIALQLYGNLVQGDTPVWLLPQLGGQNLMRGYSLGRYTDNTYTACQLETRLQLNSFFGLVFFGGAGNVYDSLESIEYSNMKYAGGGGFRFSLTGKQKINLRLDFGFSEEGIKVYFNLLEAF